MEILKQEDGQYSPINVLLWLLVVIVIIWIIASIL